MSTPAPKLSVSVSAAGYGSIELDGVRLKRLLGFDVKARAGELTEVTLHMAPVSIDMDGHVLTKITPDIEEIFLLHGWTPPPNDP